MLSNLIKRLKRLPTNRAIASTIPVLHFLHIGKTGGTALKHAITHANIERYQIILHNHATALHEIPVGEFVVFCLRDPIARFESGFYSRKRQGQPRYFSKWSDAEARAFELFADASVLIDAASDDQHSNHSEALTALCSIEHVRDHYSKWLGSVEYLASRTQDIFYVGFQETLTGHAAKIKTKLGCTKFELPDDDIAAHRNPMIDKPMLNEKHRAFLKNWYADDYRLYQFCLNELAQTP